MVEDWPNVLSKKGTILTEKQRELLLTGDIEGVADSTIRRQHQEIRKRFTEALIDLQLMANGMSIGELESLMKKVSEREGEMEDSVLAKGISSLIAMTWLTMNPVAVENAVSGGVFWGEQSQSIEMGYLADVNVDTFIHFNGGSAYHQFQELDNITLNRNDLSPLERELVEVHTE